MRVSDVVAKFLKERDIRHVFGIIGAGNVHLFDAINRLGFTEIICVHHEQAATMAMQTYYRTSGRLGCALLTTGGGSTNGITGVVSAWADSIPGLVIAGNEARKHCDPSSPMRMWGVQGYDSTQMVEKVTKKALRMEVGDDVNHLLASLCDLSLSGRPGPVWLEISMDIQASESSCVEVPRTGTADIDPKKSEISDISWVKSEIAKAKRPILWLGHGVRLSGAADLIHPLIEKFGMPTLVSWAGLDMVDGDHPLVFGSAGVYGQRAANFILQSADLVLAVGTRLAVPQVGYDDEELARNAALIIVNIDDTELMRFERKGFRFIKADARGFIEEILADSKKFEGKDEWLKHCSELRRKFPRIGPEHDDKGGYINSYRFMSKLNEELKPEQIIVTDMGTALLCAHQVLSLKAGQRLMTSTGLGEMGFGIAGAIGASFASGKGEVLCLNCDGGMMMNLQELQTIAHHKLPIKIIIFNNDGYLMIKHTQKSLYGNGYVATDSSSGLSCPDYGKIASAFGMKYLKVTCWNDFEPCVKELLGDNGPVICDVFMDPEQPFVPKLSLAMTKEGKYLSPPLEDLSPLLDLSVVDWALGGGVHEKSIRIRNHKDG